MPSRSPSAATRQARANTLAAGERARAGRPGRAARAGGPPAASPRASISASTATAAGPSSPASTSSTSTPRVAQEGDGLDEHVEALLVDHPADADDAEAGRRGDARPRRQRAGRSPGSARGTRGAPASSCRAARRWSTLAPVHVTANAAARSLRASRPGRVQRRAVDVLGVAGERERRPVSSGRPPRHRRRTRGRSGRGGGRRRRGASTRSATATACSSSFRYTLRGRQPVAGPNRLRRGDSRRPWPTAAGGGGRPGAAPGGTGGGWPAATARAVVADSDVIGGRCHGTARIASTTAWRSSSSGGRQHDQVERGRRAARGARSRWR